MADRSDNIKRYMDLSPDSGKKKRRFNFKKNRLRLLLFGIILLLIFFVITGPVRQLHQLHQEELQLQAQVDELTKQNEQIEKDIEYYKSDAYVEKAARENLGYIYPGEQVIYPYEEDSRSDD